MTFLKNRPQGKKMGIILLATLVITSLAEIISRILILKESMLNTSTSG